MKRSIRSLMGGMMVAAVGLAFTPSPAFACHQPTGLCCVETETGYYCCMFENDVIVGCGPVEVE
jgi:hypothetical protein